MNFSGGPGNKPTDFAFYKSTIIILPATTGSATNQYLRLAKHVIYQLPVMNRYFRPEQRHRAHCPKAVRLPIFLTALLLPFYGLPQAVTSIVTDYGGYWKSSQSSINAVKPDNSHNLLAFTWNGVQYSTGANNSALTSNGQTFTPADFWAMNIYSYSGTLGNSLVALGQMYDGVNNGPGVPPPSNANITDYLRDGIKGLNMGTGLSNLPAGNSFTFLAHSLNVAKIGDGVPDILLTQIAAQGTETYEFLDNSGVRVGNLVTVNFGSIGKLGNWTVDFYKPSATPMVIPSGYTKTDRELRLWAADLSLFGITAANAPNVRRFVIHMSGDSDFAFSAYNNQSIVISNVLPVTIGYFRGKQNEGKVELNWNTLSESGTSYFIVEKSRGSGFQAIDSVPATGQSASEKTYTTYDQFPSPGTSTYRLRIVDQNGAARFSPVVSVFFDKQSSLSMYPNPSTGPVTILHATGIAGDKVSVCNSAGARVFSQDILPGRSFTSFNLQALPKGVYHVSLKAGGVVKTEQLVLK